VAPALHNEPTMASGSLRFTAGLLGSTVGLVAALVGDRVHAAPPSEADFQITYYVTDEYGNRGRQISAQEMTWGVNQARCQCGQDLVARIGRTATTMVDNVQVLAMVGQQCADAQGAPGVSPYALCAQLVSGLPTVFQNGPEYYFDPIWLAHGVESTQSIDAAEPAGDCASIYGQGGIWMCAGNDCMMGTFFMQGTSNINSAAMPSGVAFDFVPPLTPPTDFAAQPGDSAVEIVWNASSVADISGYRVLCADAEGNPIESGYEFSPPAATAQLDGQIYFTRDNLCPGGPFGEMYDPEGSEWDEGTTDTGTDTGTETGAETGDADSSDTSDTEGTDAADGTDAECIDGAEGCPCPLEGDCDEGLACSNGICDPIACQSGELGCLCDDGACDPGYVCTAQNFCMPPTTGIESLDWAYICSPHISNSSQSVRVEGLENGTEYQFLVVAYDYAGNPLSSGALIKSTPVQTNGLWEQCEAQGNTCGEPGFCAVVEPSRGFGWLFGGLAIFGLASWGIRVRRRRNA
jgi:hypothetical protein